MSESRSRFVLLCQNVLACAVVVALTAPAAGVGQLEIVAPPPGTGEGGRGPATSMVAGDAVAPSVSEVQLTAAPGSASSAEPAVAGGAHRASLIASTERPARPVAEPEQTGGGGEKLVAPPQGVDGYATVGVTWDSESRLEDHEISVKVRTLDSGDWSRWQEVHYDAEHGPDPGSAEAREQRLGTDPIVVGDVDDVQVKAVTADSELPEDMRLAIVDPGESADVVPEEPEIDTAELASASTTEDELDLVGSPAPVTPKPKIYSRAQWGADERLRDRKSLSYFEVHAGFVHHTVNANGYSRAQVPSIIRGIYAYHTRGRGWSDVGYNFLVDRFGRIWEGRYGGVDRPVVGAHTLGYNDQAFAMSAIGNFESARPSGRMLSAYARLFAWKLSLHGVDATSRQWVAGKRMPAIRGHRDVGQTACPGRHLYARVGEIRRRAAGLQLPAGPRGIDTDVSGSSWPDLVVRDADTKNVLVVRTGGQLGFTNAGRAAARWGGKDLVVPTRDLTGDDVPDVLARDASSGVTALHPGDDAGNVEAPVRSYKMWRGVDQLLAVGDLDGDGANDIVGRKESSHELRVWPGRGRGRFGSSKLLSRDWSYQLTTGVGDFDGDGDADLVARDAGNDVWLIPGTGRWRLGERTRLADGWGGYGVIAGMADLTRDGDPDLVVRARRSQATYVYPGNGRGGLAHRLGPFPQFAHVDFLAGAGDVTGDGAPDLMGRNRKGHLQVWAHNRRTNIARVVRTGERFAGTDLLLNVGDWDGDGRNDLMSRRTSSGDLMFHAGVRGRGFADPVRAGKGWNGMRLVAAVGDLTGDGYPDLLAQGRRGAMRIYPGDGKHGFDRWYAAHAHIDGTDQVGAGLWNGDGSPDSIVRRGDGRLVLYPGNGPGGLETARKLASGANRYDRLVGAGDVNGDNRPDLVGRDRAGRLWLLPGKGSGFDRRRLIGDGFERFDLIG